MFPAAPSLRNLLRPVVLVALAVACNGSPSDDTGLPTETGDTGDTTDTLVEVPIAGFGTITGDCGVLDDSEWTSEQSFLFVNQLALSETYATSLLSEDAQEVVTDGNLGGSSVESEAVTMDLLYRCELADLLLTEGEVTYATEGKKTDLVVQVDERRIGVSVTRAFQYPPGSELTQQRAEELLEDKLSDILESSANVSSADGWERQILYVIAYNQQHAEQIEAVWNSNLIEDAVRADTIVIVTATSGENEFLFQ